MEDITYEGYGLAVREDLLQAQKRAWKILAEAGTWLDGEKKVNIATEVRSALSCSFCQEQKQAVSPNAPKGLHSSAGVLGDNEVEMIHRIVSDPGRLSKAWFDQIMSGGLSGEEYVEIIGIVSIVMVIDTFTCALGIESHPLPEPKTGKPSYYKSPGAKIEAAWVPIVEPDDVSESDGDLYPNPKVGYILRALSSVPRTKLDYWDLMYAHYLPEPMIYQFSQDYRAITRPQMEVVAARVAALHQCLY